eukprot:SAG31_NODE_7095_length_1789_cov_22.649704_2_plen_140_part_00
MKGRRRWEHGWMASAWWGASGRGQVPGHAGATQVWWAVKVGWTPGVYTNYPEAKAAMGTRTKKYQKCNNFEEAVQFIGGEDVKRAWDLVRAGRLDEAGADSGGAGRSTGWTVGSAEFRPFEGCYAALNYQTTMRLGMPS